MVELSLERFREIKKRTAEIFDLVQKIEEENLEITEEESKEFEREILQFIDEIHSSDLSGIPFEEYEGFYDFGFDFSETGANIDFNIIHSLGWGPVRLKGCNVRNFDFEKQHYDVDSFDEDFIKEHPDRFIDPSLPLEVQRRYYGKCLDVEDIIQYGLYDALKEGRAYKSTISFFEKIKPEVAKLIDPTIFEIDELRYPITSRLENSEEEITEETVFTVILDGIKEVLSRTYFELSTYQKILSNPSVRALIPEEELVEFGEDDELALKYWHKSLHINDIYKNPEIFKGKKFLDRFQAFQYSQSKFDGITEEQILYMFEKFPDVSKALIVSDPNLLFEFAKVIDLETTEEEISNSIESQAVKTLNSDQGENLDPDTQKVLERFYSLEVVKSRLSDFEKSSFEAIMQYTSEEKVKEYGIPPKLFEDFDILSFFTHYGLETIMEFDKANGNVFSKNNFELAKKINDYYIHYAANIHDPNKTIFYRTTDSEGWGGPYSLEDFEECVRRMIVEGPTEWEHGTEQPIDFRDFSQSFKTKFPRMFLAENAPLELQDKFYTKTISISDLGAHPDWIDFLEGKDFEVGLQYIKVYFKDVTDYGHTSSLIDVLKDLNNSESEILRFLVNNANTIKMAEMFEGKRHEEFHVSFDSIKSLDEFRNYLENEIESKILTGSLEYGEPYIPNFFKLKHPDLVLDEDAPQELKAKFYSLYYEEGKVNNSADSHSLTLQDLINEDYQKFLIGKSFDLLRNADTVKNITKIFDVKAISDLYKIDPSGFELYCLNLESANLLKQALETYPEQFAKEELMFGLKLSEEDFKSQLQDEAFRKKFESLKNGYIEDFIKNPGFLLHLEPEKRSRETLRQYKELSASNMLHGSNRFSRDSYEQILGHMLGFLGFEEAKKLLEIPAIDEETLSRIYAHDEAIKSLYEKKFEITGNLKVITKLLEGFPGLMPTPEKITSKATCKLFMSLNKKIQEGYDKDIYSLISEILTENNIAIDSDKANQLIQSVVGVSVSQKLDLVREHNSVLIDTSIEENQKTKNMIKVHYRNALEYSLRQSEKIDPKLVREYLEKEFGRVTENGQPYYSPHVTCHLDELVSFSSELASNPEWIEKLNHSVVDDLKVEAGKIGKGWIRKITSHLCYRPEKLTYEEAELLDSLVYPEGSGLEIETRATIGLKNLSEEEKSKVYTLLTNEDYQGLFTYGKAENMFSALKLPYSEKFKEFFLKHKDEFIANPDLFSKFTLIASKFDTYLEEPGFNTRYTEGILTPNDVLLKLSTDVYPNLEVGKGEHEVVYQAREGGLDEEQARIALRLFKDMQQREYQTIPQEQYETKHFRGRIVRMDDPLHFAIGSITDCCQTIGKLEPGESSMIHSATERNGSLFVVEELDDFGRPIGIVSQSWTWRNGNRVCFDNVEIPHTTERQLKEVGGFDEIMEVYQEAAKRMIEIDKIKLGKLLECGKITQEQYQAMVIKDVGMGTGCDDLIKNLSPEKRSTCPSLTSVAPLEVGKTYTGANSRTLYTDSGRAILVAHNDDFAPDDHAHTASNVGDYGIKYTKPRGIFRRSGVNIDQDKVEGISALVQKCERTDSAFADNPLHISEVVGHFGKHDLGDYDFDQIKMSMSDTSDWYILYEETETGIIMLESGIDTTNPQTDHDKAERKIALGEYTREVCKMMMDSAAKGKALTIDSYSLSKFVKADSLIESGIISIEDGAVVVKDTEKLAETISAYDKALDTSRRERLTSIDEPNR